MSFEVWSTREWDEGCGKDPSGAVWNGLFMARLRGGLHIETLRPGCHELRAPQHGRGAQLVVENDGEHATYQEAATHGLYGERRSLALFLAIKNGGLPLPINGEDECLEDVVVSALHCERLEEGFVVISPNVVRFIPTTRLFGAIGMALLSGISPDRMALPKLRLML